MRGGLRWFIPAILCSLGTGSPLWAGLWKPDLNTARAQQLLLELRLDEADALLSAQDSIGNALPGFLKARSIFFRHYVSSERSTLGPDAKRFESLLSQLSQNHPEDEPERLAALAELHLMRAFVHLRSSEQWAAGVDGLKAYQRISKLRELYPRHALSQFSSGLISATAGSLPKDYRWMTRLIGVEGNIREGVAQMKAALSKPELRQDPVFGTEMAYMYLLIRFHLFDEADGSLTDYRIDPSNSSFLLYLETQLLMASGENDRAIELLVKRPRGKAYTHYPLMDLMTGKALLNALDPNASLWFKRYLDSPTPDRSLSAVRYLWWDACIRGDRLAAETYFKRARSIVPATEADRQAVVDLEAGYNAALVQARLRFDGGYVRDALDVLAKQPPEQICRSEAERQEYRYRYGHLLFRAGRLNEARIFLEAAALCSERSYNCGAAKLYLGELYQKLEEPEKARLSFAAAAELKGYPFSEGIQRTAKARLEQLN